MDESNGKLFERIRERCFQQRWYGPDMYNPSDFFKQIDEQREQERERYSSITSNSLVFHTKSTAFWYDRNRNKNKMSQDTEAGNYPIQTGFEYPPATEEQLLASEKILGYSIHPILRAIYAKIANGGFGPGYGLNGVIGGFQDGTDNNFHRDTTSINTQNDYDEKESVHQLDLWLFGSQDYREIPFDMWPLNGLFTLCHWGCGICSYLDCSSGRVFRGEAMYDAYTLRSEATSLYEWLDLWAKKVDLWSRIQ